MTALRARADVEAWLHASGRAFRVEEPTLRVPLALPDCATTLEIHWQEEQGVEVFVPLAVRISAEREGDVDLLLAELNAALPDAGVRRSGPGAVCGMLLFFDDEGGLSAGTLARALDACSAAAVVARPRVVRAAGVE